MLELLRTHLSRVAKDSPIIAMSVSGTICDESFIFLLSTWKGHIWCTACAIAQPRRRPGTKRNQQTPGTQNGCKTILKRYGGTVRTVLQGLLRATPTKSLLLSGLGLVSVPAPHSTWHRLLPCSVQRSNGDNVARGYQPKMSRAVKCKATVSGRTYTSKYRGVHQTFPTKRWEAQFRRNGKPTSLGEST